jgi:competence protein ComEC
MVVTYATFLGLCFLPGLRRRGLPVGLCLLLLLAQIGWKLQARTGEFQATFLDVGQGDAILLELDDGKRILVDGGGTLDERFDIGEEVVAPYLWYRWIGRLDVVVLTHPQFDHLYGLKAILENFPVGEVWESGYPSQDPTHRWLQDFVRQRGIRHRRLARGDRIPLGRDLLVSVLHPPESFFLPPKGRGTGLVNNNSVVLRVEHPGLRLLLTGDIEEEAEASVLEAGGSLEADLLKVPHHGSRGSSSAAFLRHVKPRWAVIQAGDRNPFSHPPVRGRGDSGLSDRPGWSSHG